MTYELQFRFWRDIVRFIFRLLLVLYYIKLMSIMNYNKYFPYYLKYINLKLLFHDNIFQLTTNNSEVE